MDRWSLPSTILCSRKSSPSGPDRAAALSNMRQALADTLIGGIESNLDYLRQLLEDPLFASGGMTTRTLETFRYAPRTVEVLAAGTQTTIQDYPGRLGLWNVGVPPSGPMDSLSFRLANRALGNPTNAAALEMTVSGPTLKFNTDAAICLTGAEMAADIDGRPAAMGRGHRGTLRRNSAHRCAARIGLPRVSGDSRRLRRAALPGQPLDIYPGQIRRSRRPRAAGGRCAASRCFEAMANAESANAAVRGARDSGGSAARHRR